MLRKTIFNPRNLSLLLSFSCLSSAFALPQSPTVTSGSASFDYDSSDPMNLTVTATSGQTIIEWDSFSIADSEITTLTLPDSSSAILNRVTGDTASDLVGFLRSNGTVYLINENGLIMSPYCEIQTNSFLASTLDVDDTEFLDGGDMNFFASLSGGEALNNSGLIQVVDGDIILLGTQVTNADNTGNLMALSGTVALGAGGHILVQPTGDERVIVYAGSTSGANVGIDHSGFIQAKIAEIKADGTVYTLAINVGGEDATGQITAWDRTDSNASITIEADGGVVVVNGTMNVFNSDNSGGPVVVLGDAITLDNSCYIQTTGTVGGNVNIGGELHGSGINYPNATTVIFTQNAAIEASATTGDGGQVVVWSSDTVRFCGTITTEGHQSGGLVDFGGPTYLQYAGNVVNDGHITDGQICLESENIDTTPCGS